MNQQVSDLVHKQSSYTKLSEEVAEDISLVAPACVENLRESRPSHPKHDLRSIKANLARGIKDIFGLESGVSCCILNVFESPDGLH